MKELGYNVVYNLLEAADYGVPQNRERVVFIGSRDGEAATFPFPKYCKDGKKLPKWRTLRDAITGLVDPEPEFMTFYLQNKLVVIFLILFKEINQKVKRYLNNYRFFLYRIGNYIFCI